MSKQSKPVDEEPEGLTILGALAQLKQEIYQLQDEAIKRKEKPMFLIEGGELELKLVARRERKANGSLGTKFKLYVFDVDASASATQASSNETIQTLTIRFSSMRTATTSPIPDSTTTTFDTTNFVIEPGKIDSPVIQADANPMGGGKREIGLDKR